MSLDKAKAWIQQHDQQIPALTVNLQHIARLKEDEKHTARLAQIAIRDPGLALALLCRVNQNRGPDSGKDPVESPLSAISLLGDHVSHTLIEDHPAIEKVLTKPHQLLLFEQIIERSLHNETQAEQWALQMGYKQLEPFKVTALLAYLGELFCCAHDFNNYLEYIRDIATEPDESTIFGFSFNELTQALCERFHLPHLFVDALPNQQSRNPVAKILSESHRICLLSEFGWSHQSILDAMQSLADLANIPLEKVCSLSHQFAVLATQESYIEQAWTPAARLVLSADNHWGTQLEAEPEPEPEPEPELEAKPEAVAKPEPKAKPTAPAAQPAPAPKPATPDETKPGIEHALASVKQVIKQPDANQSGVVNACLKALSHDLGFARVCLLILSTDKKTLQNRMSLGVEADSALRQFAIEVDKSGLFKILLQKPQGILITRDNIQKYQKAIPPRLLASIRTDAFAAMSLFIGPKPIGIIYVDQHHAKQVLNNDAFLQFKQLINLSSKALTLLSKR